MKSSDWYIYFPARKERKYLLALARKNIHRGTIVIKDVIYQAGIEWSASSSPDFSYSSS